MAAWKTKLFHFVSGVQIKLNLLWHTVTMLLLIQHHPGAHVAWGMLRTWVTLPPTPLIILFNVTLLTGIIFKKKYFVLNHNKAYYSIQRLDRCGKMEPQYWIDYGIFCVLQTEYETAHECARETQMCIRDSCFVFSVI